MVVEHRLNVLEPLQLWRCLMIMEGTSEEHQPSSHKCTNGGTEKLKFVRETASTPHVEQAGRDLNAVETGTHITVQDLLAKNGPDHLSRRLDIEWIGKPTAVVGEACAVVIGTAQPDEDDGQMAEVSAEDLSRDILQVARVTVKIVGTRMQVPNPRGGLGTLFQCAVEMTRRSKHVEIDGHGIPVNTDLALCATLWWANGH